MPPFRSVVTLILFAYIRVAHAVSCQVSVSLAKPEKGLGVERVTQIDYRDSKLFLNFCPRKLETDEIFA